MALLAAVYCVGKITLTIYIPLPSGLAYIVLAYIALLTQLSNSAKRILQNEYRYTKLLIIVYLLCIYIYVLPMLFN